MLVSIITPSYNAEKYLALTIESVLAQTYQDWEMLIVDDCSPDNANQIVEEYAKKDSRIKLIKLDSNSGAASARNKAIALALGRYIAFLDSDDLWFPEKLEIQIDFMQKNDFAFTYTAYEKVNENGKFFQVVNVPRKISYRKLLKTNVIGCLTAIYDVKKLGKVYMPTTTKREDFATWLNILKNVECGYGVQEALAKYRVYDTQSSSNKVRMAGETWKLYRNVEKLSFFESIYFFLHYAVFGLLRAKFPKISKLLSF